MRLNVGQSDDYFTANNDYDSSFFVGGMEGSGLLRGRVEYCDRGSYVGICYDSSWDVKDATVVCRQLGFSPYGEAMNVSLTMLLIPRNVCQCL